jgi:predicted nucleotidyltransferase
MRARTKQPTKAIEIRNPAVRAALAELRTALSALYGEHSPAIIVYGSQARGDATPESDVDVLLVYRDAVRPGREIRRVSPILADLNLRYGFLIAVLPTSEAEYREGTSPLWRNIRREGVGFGAV